MEVQVLRRIWTFFCIHKAMEPPKTQGIGSLQNGISVKLLFNVIFTEKEKLHTNTVEWP